MVGDVIEYSTEDMVVCELKERTRRGWNSVSLTPYGTGTGPYKEMRNLTGICK